MNSIERVKAAIHFERPDRVPVLNNYFSTGLRNNDVVPLALIPSKNWRPGWGEGEEGVFPHSDFLLKWKKPEWAKLPQYKDWKKGPREEIDEWGIYWNEDGTHSTIGYPGRANLTDLNKVDEFRNRYFPNPEDPSRYRLAKLGKILFGKIKYKMGILGFGPFEIASDLLGFNRFMTAPRRFPEQFSYLMEQITDILVAEMRYFMKLGLNPHGFMIYDDLGGQNREFMSAKLFAKFFKPIYRRLFNTAHELKTEFHLHSCGKITQYVPLFIDWGLDAFEFDSPRMTGYTDLKPFRGKIMFWGCVNIQSIYVNGSPDQVEREVWHMMRNLGTKNGGFGAYYYPQTNHILTPKENVKAFTRGLKNYGVYKKIPDWWWDCPITNEWSDNEVPPFPKV